MSRAFWVLVLGIAAVLAAGCGGGEDESASEAWVGDLCSSAAEWRASLEDTVSDLPSELSADGVRDAIEKGLDATEEFVDEVRSLGPPETEAGEEAAAIVDSLTTELESTVEDLRDSIPEDASLPEVVQQLSQSGDRIAEMGQELQSSLDELRELDGGEELRTAVEANEDCAAARAGLGR